LQISQAADLEPALRQRSSKNSLRYRVLDEEAAQRGKREGGNLPLLT